MRVLKIILVLMTTVFFIQAKAIENDAEKELVKAAISSHMDEMRKCFNETYKKHKKVEAKVAFDFDIDDQGHLVKTELNSKKTNLNNEELNQCMTEKFKTWFFTPSPKGTVLKVTYPFSFKKRN